MITVCKIIDPAGATVLVRPPSWPGLAAYRSTPGYEVQDLDIDDTPLTNEQAEEVFRDAKGEPVPDNRIKEMVRYATDPDYRAVKQAAYVLRRELEEVKAELARVKHIGWLVFVEYYSDGQMTDMHEVLRLLRETTQPETSEPHTNA